jgi:hypothetical protein
MQDRDESFRRAYYEEESFVDEFHMVAWEATKALAPGEWNPDSGCNDNSRKQRDYFMKTGELGQLCFMTAEIFDTADGFSSAKIFLESADRAVAICVRRLDGTLVAEKIGDRTKDKKTIYSWTRGCRLKSQLDAGEQKLVVATSAVLAEHYLPKNLRFRRLSHRPVA